jgi:hypothetical protein
LCKITKKFVVINKNSKIIQNILKIEIISDIIIIPLNKCKWKGITMRNSKLTKIISVMLACVVMLACAFAVSVFADGDDPAPARVTVVSKNVAFEARTEIHFAVKCDDLQENEELYLLFWETAPDLTLSSEELYKGASYRKIAYAEGQTVKDVEGCMLFASNGIAASKINSDIYVLPVIKSVDDSGDAPAFTYEVGGELLEYSVRDYAEEKLLDVERTAAQEALCNSIKVYGDAAAKIFAD